MPRKDNCFPSKRGEKTSTFVVFRSGSIWLCKASPIRSTAMVYKILIIFFCDKSLFECKYHTFSIVFNAYFIHIFYLNTFFRLGFSKITKNSLLCASFHFSHVYWIISCFSFTNFHTI